MNCMFHSCENLENLDLSSFQTEKVRDMSLMFYGCKSLINLNISNFKVKHANLSNIFKDCNLLKKVNCITKDEKILQKL